MDYKGGERSYLLTKEFSSHHQAALFYMKDKILNLLRSEAIKH
jgi:hypothetical protein